MRLIDAETFPNKLKEMMIQIDKNRGEPEEDWFLYGFDEFVIALDVIDLVKEMPTVDAEPVSHGRWIFNPKDAIEMMFTLPKCSECGAESPNGGNYCPNCGARMDGEENEANAEY